MLSTANLGADCILVGTGGYWSPNPIVLIFVGSGVLEPPAALAVLVLRRRTTAGAVAVFLVHCGSVFVTAAQLAALLGMLQLSAADRGTDADVAAITHAVSVSLLLSAAVLVTDVVAGIGLVRVRRATP